MNKTVISELHWFKISHVGLFITVNIHWSSNTLYVISNTAPQVTLNVISNTAPQVTLYVICNTVPQVTLYTWNSGNNGREKAPATRKFPQPVEKLLVGHLTKKFPTFMENTSMVTNVPR
jgi:hypothetical protein